MNRTVQKNLLLDVAIGLAARLVATKVTGFAQQAFYKPMPRSVKKLEEEVRPGPPPKVAARKTAEALGVELDEKKLMPVAVAIHYGLGAAWGPSTASCAATAKWNHSAPGLLQEPRCP